MSNGILKALSAGRRAAESRMLDTVSVTRESERVWDEENGAWVGGQVVVYVGKARVKDVTLTSPNAEAGSQLIVIGALEVHVPVGTAGFASADQVEVTACPTRPEQVGRVFTITGPFDAAQSTALKYRAEVADQRG